MMMSNQYRQHPLMIFYEVIDSIKSFLFPIILVLGLQIMGEGRFSIGYLLTPLGFAGLSFLIGIFRWIFYTYSFEEDRLIVRSGIFVKKERVLKKARVQSVNLEKGILHRILSLSSVHIETAGSVSEAEFSMSAVKRDAAHRLKQFFEAEVSEDSENQYDYRYKASYNILWKAALTSGSIGFILSVLAFFFSQVFWYLPDRVTDALYGWFFQSGIGVIVMLGAFLVLIAWFVSVIQYMVRFGEFTLMKRSDEITIHRGLIKQKALTFKRHRVQSVLFVEGLLRQPFKYLTIDVDIAGGVNYRDQARTSLYPLVKSSKAHNYVSTLLNKTLAKDTLEPLDKKACRRYLFRAAIIFVLPIGLSFINIIFIYLLLFLPVSLLLGYWRYKDAGTYEDSETMILRFRWIARTTVFVEKYRIQSIEVTQTPFQKWRKFATIHVHVLSASGKSSYSVRDLRLAKALKLAAYSVKSI